ncbi:hypothetical protein LTS18_001668 [Coniosporium uncinatum]|uniref:Uncharacterized protein n=1 Tax=Coniosporium uncinatum TaxID=93489 RepID=A0ACC3D896_9PEZI|nr:hypothetical protein LTS18_001668 [Coniosporium uncinatum]
MSRFIIATCNVYQTLRNATTLRKKLDFVLRPATPSNSPDPPLLTTSSPISICPNFHARSNHAQAAAPTYIHPVNSCAPRYLPPLLAVISSAIASENVTGSIKTNHNIDSEDGTFFRPMTSAMTGATVAQNVPATVPPMRAKKMRTPKEEAGIHITRLKRPQRKVMVAAMLMRPKLSLK